MTKKMLTLLGIMGAILWCALPTLAQDSDPIEPREEPCVIQNREGWPPTTPTTETQTTPTTAGSTLPPPPPPPPPTTPTTAPTTDTFPPPVTVTRPCKPGYVTTDSMPATSFPTTAGDSPTTSTPPSENLARTGSGNDVLARVAVILVAGGAALLLLARKRQNKSVIA